MDGLWIDFPYSQYQMGILARPQWFRPRCLYIADGSEPKHLLCTGSRREVMISQTKTTAVNAHTLAHTWVFWDPMIKTHVDFAAWCNSLMISTECITGVGIDARWTTCTWGKKPSSTITASTFHRQLQKYAQILTLCVSLQYATFAGPCLAGIVLISCKTRGVVTMRMQLSLASVMIGPSRCG